MLPVCREAFRRASEARGRSHCCTARAGERALRAFCVEEQLCDQTTYIALGKTKRDDRSGEKQTKSQCGGQAPRQGQNGGSIFFSPPLLLAPSSPFFFLQRNKKLNLVSFFVQALFLGFEGVFCFYFSLIDLLIIS